MQSDSPKPIARYTITSALPYANGPIHIGHLAGAYIPADIYARYQRLRGREVLFIGGSDEHGVPITIKARKDGVSPQQIVDRYHEMIKKSFADFGISFDIYSRTSAPIHHETASDFFMDLYNKGEFVEKTTQQFFDAEQQIFLADRYVTGTCPHCHNDRAYGDQCESCGTSLNATDLINPTSTLSGSEPILKDTKHWFLPLDKYEGWLREWIDSKKDTWKVNVYGQCKSWLDQGLQPRAVTRDLDWGVKVPLEGAEGKVLYVWFDAPIGYISATREWAERENTDWEPWWKAADTKLVHFIGKDNIVFHCIVFPGMLKAEGSYILPEDVPANEFLNLENDKISTSRNWAVWLHEYLQDFPGRQDVLRYVLTAGAPETKDNDFTWKDFQTRNNSELLAIFGNLVNRTLVLTQKYFDGKVPEKTQTLDEDRSLLYQMFLVPGNIARSIEQYRFREALGELMNLARMGNKYLTDMEPWKIYKENPERVKDILNVTLQICASLAILSEPFLPFTSAKLKVMMNLGETKWSDAGTRDFLKAGHQLGTPELLFERIEDADIEQQMKKLQAVGQANNETAAPSFAPLKSEITYEDFSKLDLRTATVLEAERVPKTDKLLKLTVDTGVETRTIVSGIAQHFTPEELIGCKVTVVMNLAPRKLKGIESKGMLLTSEDPATGKLSLVSSADDCRNGCEIK